MQKVLSLSCDLNKMHMKTTLSPFTSFYAYQESGDQFTFSLCFEILSEFYNSLNMFKNCTVLNNYFFGRQF